jgi:hypothetical protein
MNPSRALAADLLCTTLSVRQPGAILHDAMWPDLAELELN